MRRGRIFDYCSWSCSIFNSLLYQSQHSWITHPSSLRAGLLLARVLQQGEGRGACGQQCPLLANKQAWGGWTLVHQDQYREPPQLSMEQHTASGRGARNYPKASGRMQRKQECAPACSPFLLRGEADLLRAVENLDTETGTWKLTLHRAARSDREGKQQ